MSERQRVSTARALLRRAPLVLCDEPTSAVGLPTDRAITDGPRTLAENATVVIVALHLETIRQPITCWWSTADEWSSSDNTTT